MGQPLVVYYHHISTQPRPDHWFFRNAGTFDAFRREMEFLRAHYVPISVTELADCLEHGRPCPQRSVVVTFDDGFRSNLEAAKLLHELSVPACFFIITDTTDSGFVPLNLRFLHAVSTRSVSTVQRDGMTFDLRGAVQGRRWLQRTWEELLLLPPAEREERLQGLTEALGATSISGDDPDYRYLSSSDLRAMRGMGMTIGCHSETHDNMARCEQARLHAEMVRARQRLEKLVGAAVEFFAYPDGRFNQRARELARQHYRMAFAIENGDRWDRWAFPRRNADGQTLRHLLSWRFTVRKGLACGLKRALGIG